MARPKLGEEKQRYSTITIRVDNNTLDKLKGLVEHRKLNAYKTISRADVITELIHEAYDNEMFFESEPYDDDPVDSF